jgi:hypothetical protein
MELDTNSWCRILADPWGKLGNTSVATLTETCSDGRELMQTLETATFNIFKYGLLCLKLQLNG